MQNSVVVPYYPVVVVYYCVENDAFHFGIEFHFAFDLCVASKFPLCVVIFIVNVYVCVTRQVYSIVFITSLRFDRIMLIIDFSEKISHSFIVVAVIIVDIIIIVVLVV